MNYLPLPDSELKLVDGNIVILERFPESRWILHNGWYEYEGQSYSGWYFVSILDDTVLPVCDRDLHAIVVVSTSSNDGFTEYPAKPCPHPHHPGRYPHPIFPPVPPDPETERPAFFSVELKKELDAAFISVPSIKKRDKLIGPDLPDGKIVRVNNVGGEPKYYVWSASFEEWQELNFATTEEIVTILENYYTSEQVDQIVEVINEAVSEIAEDIPSIEEDLSDMEDRITIVEKSIPQWKSF